jgi:hypothetical protein
VGRIFLALPACWFFPINYTWCARVKPERVFYTERLLAFFIHEGRGFVIQKARDFRRSPFGHAADVHLHERIGKKAQIPTCGY